MRGGLVRPALNTLGRPLPSVSCRPSLSEMNDNKEDDKRKKKKKHKKKQVPNYEP